VLFSIKYLRGLPLPRFVGTVIGVVAGIVTSIGGPLTLIVSCISSTTRELISSFLESIK
jgi:LytS/YehU family sensor histidine kinase